MEAGLSLNHFFGSKRFRAGRSLASAPGNQCRGTHRRIRGTRSTWMVTARTRRQDPVVRQAEGIELHAGPGRRRCRAHRVAISEAGGAGDTARALRIDWKGRWFWLAYSSSAAWQSPRSSPGVWAWAGSAAKCGERAEIQLDQLSFVQADDAADAMIRSRQRCPIPRSAGANYCRAWRAELRWSACRYDDGGRRRRSRP